MKFDDAISSVLRFMPRRRFLTAIELLTLNFVDEAIRSSTPVYSIDYSLLYEVEDSKESPELAVNVWTINPTSYYRGNALRAGDCFATTSCTALETANGYDLVALEKLLAMQFATPQDSAQVPRLTA